MRTLLAFFDGARHYRQVKLSRAKDFQTDLRFEALLPVLDGATPLFVTAVREREIREAIEFAAKQKIKIILADAYEAYKVLPLIQSHKMPVVLGPTRTLPLDPDDPEDRSYTTPGELYKAESNSRLPHSVRRLRATFRTRLRLPSPSDFHRKRHTRPYP